MLNHEKLFKELAHATQAFFVDYGREQVTARQLWEQIRSDAQFTHKIQHNSWPYLVPLWQGNLDAQELVESRLDEYCVYAVDGSQIYPDRHQGVACYLINIGTALLQYGQFSGQSKAQFSSQPFLMTAPSSYLTERDDAQGTYEMHPDMVNCQRTEFEFRAGLEMSQTELLRDKAPVFLFDGSLIFWHLDSKEEPIKNRFLTSYCDLLQQLYVNKVLHAGYISLPKSRELVNLLRIKSEQLTEAQQDKPELVFNGSCLVDADVVQFYLKPHHRTLVFENRSPIVASYPPPLRPHFFYLHNGVEVVRIEIPAWIANDAALVAKIASVILNQSLKGNGYPVCLAEAHEQAVVKAADRELFYVMLQKIMHEKKLVYPVSQKSMHKRSLGI
jgi:hypothetical protein